MDDPRKEFLTEDEIIKASAWYIRHKDHVDFISESELPFPPSEQDRAEPTLWKGGAWAWFLQYASIND